MEIKLHRINTDNNHNLSLFETAGFSMWPFLKDGEKLIVKKASIRDLKIGDIILYRADGKTICHRLIRKIIQGKIQMLYARADNSTQIEPVNEEMFLGKVTAIIKNKRIVNLCTKRQQFINQLIVVIAPWIARTIRIIKPLYSRLQKNMTDDRN